MLVAEIEGKWAKMSAEEERTQRFGRRLHTDIEFASSEAEERYQGRVTRFVDAICLDENPDCVSICTTMGFFLGWYASLSPYECTTDAKRAFGAWHRCNIESQLSTAVSAIINAVPFVALEVLDLEHYPWPDDGRQRGVRISAQRGRVHAA